MDRLKDNPKLRSLALYYYEQGNSNLDFYKHCLDTKDIKKCMPKASFWRDVWLAWSRFHMHNNNTKNQILVQNLNLNSKIRIANRPAKFHSLTKAGLTKVKDIYNSDESRLLTYNEIAQNRNINFLEYTGLLHAFPNNWLIVLASNEEEDPILETKGMWASRRGKLSSRVYRELTDNYNLFDKYRCKWEELLDTEISQQNFTVARQNVYELSTNVKMRSFQTSLLCHAVLTNKTLYKRRIVESDRCTFCNDHYETIIHLLYDCEVTQRFWTLLINWYECLTNQEFNLTKIQVFVQMGKKITTLDCIILLAKQYIYLIRCLDKELNFYNFKDHLYRIVKYERYYAAREGKRTQFCKKWSPLLV